MKICAKCYSAIWPYLIALFIASITGFLTWLILGYSDFDATEQIFIAAGMFLVTGVSLAHYMMICVQRHCHHNHNHNNHNHNHRRRNAIINRQRQVGV